MWVDIYNICQIIGDIYEVGSILSKNLYLGLDV